MYLQNKDVPVFVLSLIGCVGWLTFTISMAVAFSDMNEKYRALNSVTFVHYAVAALGLICTLLYVWYASNLSQLLRALYTLLSTYSLCCVEAAPMISAGLSMNASMEPRLKKLCVTVFLNASRPIKLLSLGPLSLYFPKC